MNERCFKWASSFTFQPLKMEEVNRDPGVSNKEWDLVFLFCAADLSHQLNTSRNPKTARNLNARENLLFVPPFLIPPQKQ